MQPEPVSQSSPNDGPLEPAPQARQARELTADSATQLKAELHQLMTAERRYLEPELTLPSLASALKVTSHQASELLNVHMDTSFYDYVNQHRLQHAAQLLKSPACQLRVIDIAYQSGFNNKNSFYRLFKQYFAMTPSAYRSAKQAHPHLNPSISIENDRQSEMLN